MAVVSGVGTVLMDFKKAQTLGPGWSTYTSVTSNLPFLAIASGRNRLVWGELLWPAVVGIGLYVLTYIFHEWLSGGAVIV